MGKYIQRINLPLRSARVLKRMHQWELAELVGIHYTEMCKIENGRRVPTEEIKRKISKVLNVPIAQLFRKES